MIVIGGARGIGAAGVLGCLQAGASVAVLDSLPSPSEEEWAVATQVAREAGVNLKYAVVDITLEATLSLAISDVFASAPSTAPVKGLFVTAGVNAPVSGLDLTMDKWDKVYDINVKGSFLCSQLFAQEWLKAHLAPSNDLNDTASIVLTASMFGHIANRVVSGPAYATSKAAVRQMGRALGAEWGKHGIRVNVR